VLCTPITPSRPITPAANVTATERSLLFATLWTPVTPRQRQNGPFCCCMMLFAVNMLQCIVNGEENPQNCLLPLGSRHPAGGRPSHGHRQHAQKIFVKIACVVLVISCWTDRPKHTHTILRHHSYGRSKILYILKLYN